MRQVISFPTGDYGVKSLTEVGGDVPRKVKNFLLEPDSVAIHNRSINFRDSKDYVRTN